MIKKQYKVLTFLQSLLILKLFVLVNTSLTWVDDSRLAIGIISITQDTTPSLIQPMVKKCHHLQEYPSLQSATTMLFPMPINTLWESQASKLYLPMISVPNCIHPPRQHPISFLHFRHQEIQRQFTLTPISQLQIPQRSKTGFNF